MIYEVLEQECGQILVRHNSDGSISTIPLDAANSDYQRYLRWLEDPTAEESGTL